MRIPFTKAHGDRNDFLLTWANDVHSADLPGIARAICERHTGIGADGWILVSPAAQDGSNDGSIRLINSDGSAAEISGNGTRCAAAFLYDAGHESASIRIRTGAGLKHLRPLERKDLEFLFEMNMGRPVCRELRAGVPLAAGPREATILDVGNPQCAVPVADFDFDWRAMGAEIEGHPLFPARTNVSFFRCPDRHNVEARFYERGAGETMSSGTGSTGAAAAALFRGMVESPVTVHTAAGTLDIRFEDGEALLTGPAVIVAGGEFYLP